jgi:hypothetical protein
MKIETTMRYHLSTVRMAVCKNKNNEKHWQGCEENATFIPCW